MGFVTALNIKKRFDSDDEMTKSVISASACEPRRVTKGSLTAIKFDEKEGGGETSKGLKWKCKTTIAFLSLSLSFSDFSLGRLMKVSHSQLTRETALSHHPPFVARVKVCEVLCACNEWHHQLRMRAR